MKSVESDEGHPDNSSEPVRRQQKIETHNDPIKSQVNRGNSSESDRNQLKNESVEVNQPNSSEPISSQLKNQTNEDSSDVNKAFRVLDKIEKLEKILSESKQKATKSIIEETVMKWFDMLSGNKSSMQRQEFHETYTYLLEHFEITTVEYILNSTLQSLYSVKSPVKHFDNLYYIWQYPSVSNRQKNFEFMIKSQLMLYRLYKLHQPQSFSNDKYLRKFGYFLFSMRKNNLYQNMDLNFQSEIANITESLPDSLAIFKPSFCMMNADSKQYLYTSVFKIGLQSHYIMLFHGKGRMSTIEAEDIQIDKNGSWKVIFRGTLLKLYYYTMTNFEMNVAGIPGNKELQASFVWNLTFLQNGKIALLQRGLIMCSGSIYVENIVQVNGFKYGRFHNENNPICQWIIRSCN